LNPLLLKEKSALIPTSEFKVAVTVTGMTMFASMLVLPAQALAPLATADICASGTGDPSEYVAVTESPTVSLKWNVATTAPLAVDDPLGSVPVLPAPVPEVLLAPVLGACAGGLELAAGDDEPATLGGAGEPPQPAIVTVARTAETAPSRTKMLIYDHP
jgi:hypothetical protein